MKNYSITFFISGLLVLGSFIFAEIGTPGSLILAGICIGFWICLAWKSFSIDNDKKRGRLGH